MSAQQRHFTETELLEIVEVHAVDRACGILRQLDLGIHADRLSETLSRMLVHVLFPFARQELRQPRRTRQEVAEFAACAILTAVKEALETAY